MATSESNAEVATSKVSITPPSLAQDPNLNAIRQKASAPGSKYAFLVHSTDSLRNGEDPSIDNKPLARQKRRRTSPEDQAILEASFARNPKPDKAARMALVGKVALGEKEVQIWFQNRRQSTRRKQRPLEPHELSGLAHGAPLSPPYDASTASDSRVERHDQSSPSRPGHSLEKSQGAGEDKENADPETDTSRRVPVPEAQNASLSFTDSLPFASSQESNSGRWLSNKRSAAPFRSFHESMSQATEPNSQPASQESPEDPAGKGPKKAPSIIRLSFGADGTAIVRNGDSPSPPRKQLPPPVTPASAIPGPQFSRSYSTSTLNEPASQESTKSNPLRRVSSFRSHDSRAWEFFCDRDVRGELEERAEQEQSGSAADAIKLARSNSAKSLRRSLSGKRTMAPYAEVSSSKRVKTAAPAGSVPASTPLRETTIQPLQQRSLSASNPRRATYTQTPGKLLHKTPKLKQTPTFEIPATDSDKENWSPERHLTFIQSMSTSPAVPPTTTSKRRAPLAHTPLRRGTSPVKTGSGNVRRRPRDQTQVIVMEDDDDGDDEVAAFMGEDGNERRVEDSRSRQSRKSDSVSEEEDLDCVQGLLSLSQGAWR